EFVHGPARQSKVTCVVALGTGIGAGLLIDGQLYRGAYGVAPELGHLQVVPDGRPCDCGKRGCWERYCSGTALVETA
ncbi:ROK family protein, partial [Mycobacterium kansasii]